MKKRVLVLLLALQLPAAHSAPPDCSGIITAEDSAFADQYHSWLSAGEFEKTLGLLDPKFRADMEPLQPSFQKAFSEVKTFDRVMIGCHVHTTTVQKGAGAITSRRTVNLSYQWSSPGAWYTGNLAWAEEEGTKSVYGLHMKPLPAPLEKTHAFTLENKGVIHWFFLAVTVMNPIFVFFALVICIRTRPLKRKWAWMLFILFGIFQVSLDWTSGGILFKPLSLQMFASGLYRQNEFAPWIMTISVPLGAVCFLFKRRKKYQPENVR